MSFKPKFVEPVTDSDLQENTAYYRRVLHELIDRGADMARMVHERAKRQAEAVEAEEAGADGAAGPDLTVAFDRVARCVRRCVALAQRLDEPVARRDAALERVAGRRQVLRAVEDRIHREASPREADGLRGELQERLDAPEFDEDLGTRPVADIIAEICDDLGIGSLRGLLPTVRRTPEDVAMLHARAAAPTRPVGLGRVLDVATRDTC